MAEKYLTSHANMDARQMRRVRFADEHPSAQTALRNAVPMRAPSALRKRKAACLCGETAASEPAAPRAQPATHSDDPPDAAAAGAIAKERLVRALEAALAADPSAGARLRRAQGARLQAALVQKRRRERQLAREALLQQQLSPSSAAACDTLQPSSECSTATNAKANTSAQPSASASV